MTSRVVAQIFSVLVAFLMAATLCQDDGQVRECATSALGISTGGLSGRPSRVFVWWLAAVVEGQFEHALEDALTPKM